ncbi:PadR family transcriptional regulator [Telmatospirillum siberiense]|uniref:PadR family transcriptional regulator n=2 Tax=Telmatospirillum siberiense TaxID=382514 RepID=A0A2N3PYE4_9PROT|nr:PadR family transcriptional regulator [Telmatospirillum siberiense]
MPCDNQKHSPGRHGHHSYRDQISSDGPRDGGEGGHAGCRHAHGDFRQERGHGGGGRMRGGRLGRFFEHGDLRFVVLGLIAEKPRHGYEIIKAIEDSVGGAYSPSPGTIYPTLTLLEEQGYIAMEASEDSKKSYAMTPDGRAFLETNRPIVDALRARMATMTEDGPAPQIIRAMENLKLALRLRLGRGPLTGEQIAHIAEVLDRTAGEIERS